MEPGPEGVFGDLEMMERNRIEFKRAEEMNWFPEVGDYNERRTRPYCYRLEDGQEHDAVDMAQGT